MDTQLTQALREWSQRPHDPATVSSLISLFRRAGEPLPEPLDLPHWTEHVLLEQLNACYQVHDAAGYGHLIALSVHPSATVSEPGELKQALSVCHYPCLTVGGLYPVDSVDFGAFYGIGYGEQGEPESHANARHELVRLTQLFAERVAAFPQATCFRVHADFPHDGQVYWSRCDMVCVPELGVSLVFVLQYFW